MTTLKNLAILAITKTKKYASTILIIVSVIAIAAMVFFVMRAKRLNKQGIVATEMSTATVTMTATATASPTATPTLIPTEEPTATSEPLVVSVDAGRSADLTISNASNRNIAIYWVDYDGEEQYTKRLIPGQAYTQPTMVGHVWRVRDEASGELVEEITIKNRETNRPILIAPALADAMGPTLVPTVTPTPFVTTDLAGCQITEPEGTYFEKMCYVDGIKILASGKVSDKAVQQAWLIVTNMLAPRPDIREQLSNRGVEIQIFAIGETVEDLPSASMITPEGAWAFAEKDGTPLVITGEANLLCLPGYRNYYGNNVLVHELGHVIHMVGLENDSSFDNQLSALYSQEIAAGKWVGHYAETDKFEFWAEGVSMYFDANKINYWDHYVNRRDEFREYAPEFYAFVEQTFRGFKWSPNCP